MSRPLCLFDVDRTLLEGRTITHLANRFGFRDRLDEVLQERQGPGAAGTEESERVAALLAGIHRDDIDAACRELPLREGAREAIAGLRALGARIGAVSASYTYVTGHVADLLDLDFHVGAELEVQDGRLTGRLLAPTFTDACGLHVCKAQVLEAFCDDATHTIAVGDGFNDLCMFDATDFAVAVEPCPPAVRLRADVVVRDLRAIPSLVRHHFPAPAAEADFAVVA